MDETTHRTAISNRRESLESLLSNLGASDDTIKRALSDFDDAVDHGFEIGAHRQA